MRSKTCKLNRFYHKFTNKNDIWKGFILDNRIHSNNLERVNRRRITMKLLIVPLSFFGLYKGVIIDTLQKLGNLFSFTVLLSLDRKLHNIIICKIRFK